MDARAGCEMEKMDVERGENFIAVVCGRKAVGTPFEKQWEVLEYNRKMAEK